MTWNRDLVGAFAVIAVGVPLTAIVLAPRTPVEKSTGPATHAVVASRYGEKLDVWKDTRERLTFHWVGATRGDIMRFVPKRFEIDEDIDADVLGQSFYRSNRDAWAHIERRYGVNEPDVERALASGDPSPQPWGFNYPRLKPLRLVGYETGITNYGRNVARMAKETGFVVPRLTTLGGYPLLGDSAARGIVAVVYGSRDLRRDAGQIEVNIARRGYRKFYERRLHHYRTHGVRYVIVGDYGAIFPYRGEWIFVAPLDVDVSYRSVIGKIVTAPTAG